jgi:hypothetical protein
MPSLNHRSLKSFKRQRQFADQAFANPNSTVRELSVISGLAPTTVRIYLDHMSDLGVVETEAVPNIVPRTLAFVIKDGYAAALDSELEFAREVDHVPMRREIRKHWAPHHVRDSLVAALFGEARVAA